MKIALDVMGGDNAPDINAWRSFRLRKLWK